MALPYDPASQVTNILHQLTATSAQINQAASAYNPVENRTSLRIGAARKGLMGEKKRGREYFIDTFAASGTSASCPAGLALLLETSRIMF